MKKFAFMLLLVAAASLMLHQAAMAAGYQPIKVDPSRFIFEGKPGQEVTGSITVTNKGTENTTARAVLQDWILNYDNSFTIQEAGSEPSTLSGLVKFNPRVFVAKPGTPQTVRFTIKIPKDAQPGEKRGMISFEQTYPKGEATGTDIKVQVACTIYVAILPADRRCEIVGGVVRRDPASSSTKLLLDLKGTGTAHFRGVGAFNIFKKGETTPTLQGELPTLVVVPDATVQYIGTAKGTLDAGEYQVVIRIDSDQPKVPPLTRAFDFVLN